MVCARQTEQKEMRLDYTDKGNLFGLEWLHYHRRYGYSTNVMDHAAQNGYYKVVA
jgi:hypothetical protein